ncbi:hypothetical protein BZ163_01285, partial [Pseudomonas sp. VI4.1]
GVEEHEVSDPITQTTTTWIEGMGKTVTHNNLFDKPDNVKRYKQGDEPSDPLAEPYSEHRYHYDGLGRTAHEFDALGYKTAYVYDVFDRMVESTLPDGAVVERRYAPHSSEDLPIWIGVNAKELGQQAFDGLDRMIKSITGGRVTVYGFKPGETQPCKVKRPSLVEVDYEYVPALGEEPTKRSTASIAGSAAGIAATYNYDLQNARLDWSEESGLKLSRTYYSTGEIRSETREQPGHEPATMEYHYSRQARLLKYVDVLEQDQVYDYKKSSGQLMGTRLGTTAATFAYNAQGQTERIETTDGPLSLKIKLTYDDQGREILREFDFGEGRTQQLSQAYNVVDQLIHRALTEGETVLRDETYDYDARGRLQLYICTGTQQPLDPYNKPIDMQIFIFDELDNLIQVQTTSPDGTNFAEYSYDNPLDPTQLSTVLNDHEDYLPKEIKLVYNDDGDMVSDEAGRTLGYDDLGRLISVSGLPGETPSGYTYDPLDVLASQSSGTDQQRRFYRDGEIHTLQQGSNSSTFMQADGRVLAEHQEGAGPKS